MKRLPLCLLILAGSLTADRVLKLGVAHLQHPRPLVGDLLRLTCLRNTGAAFGTFSAYTGLLTLITGILMVAGIVILFIGIRRRASRLLLVALSLILGGGIGNLADRIYYGYVIDMFDLRSFAVFNVADILVCAGCVLLCIYLFFFTEQHQDHAHRPK